MSIKQVTLASEWNLIFHENYSLFVDIESMHKYSIIDVDNDLIAIFTLDDSSVAFQHSVYNLQHTIDFAAKTIDIKHKPYEEEGE
ncbi:hypothetical protein [Niallia taxi]|uniref:hypothetical protein n=1 Tax=Niallia taxi TaxID=2499688 RepID=UPI002E221581|nr:hypothetical protein [Niallia taxi]MED4057360.1 hypothetical protein [Niallia taxi]MED4118855.1 hypothetical protein [Niallia taxi]